MAGFLFDSENAALFVEPVPRPVPELLENSEILGRFFSSSEKTFWPPAKTREPKAAFLKKSRLEKSIIVLLKLSLH